MIEESSQETKERKAGGPEQCPRRCVDCPDGAHHFGEYFGFAHEDPETMRGEQTGPNHPAAKAGLEAWQNCKHCEAWREMLASDDDDVGDSDSGDDGFNPRDWV